MGFSRQEYWSGVPLPLLGSGTLVHCFSQFLSLTSEMTFLIFLKKIYRFIYLFNLWLFGCAGAFSSWGQGLLSSCGAWAFYCSGFSCFGAQTLVAQASVVVLRGLNCCNSWAIAYWFSSCSEQVVLLRVGSSWTMDQTFVPCISRQILYHWATMEAPFIYKQWIVCIAEYHPQPSSLLWSVGVPEALHGLRWCALSVQDGWAFINVIDFNNFESFLWLWFRYGSQFHNSYRGSFLCTWVCQAAGELPWRIWIFFFFFLFCLRVLYMSLKIV